MATRRLLVRLLTFVGGLYFVVEFLVPGGGPDGGNFLSPYLGKVTSGVKVVAAMALLLGPISLVRSHLTRIIRSQSGRLYSITFLVFLGFGITASLAEWLGGMELLYDVAIYGFGLALGATSMAILAFYLMSAAYRAFRLNNLDSGVMMGSAVIVLLGLVPLGEYITGALPERLQLQFWASWILEVPNVAVQRAVLIGAVAGAFAAGLRQWLGLGRVVE